MRRETIRLQIPTFTLKGILKCTCCLQEAVSVLSTSAAAMQGLERRLNPNAGGKQQSAISTRPTILRMIRRLVKAQSNQNLLKARARAKGRKQGGPISGPLVSIHHIFFVRPTLPLGPSQLLLYVSVLKVSVFRRKPATHEKRKQGHPDGNLGRIPR